MGYIPITVGLTLLSLFVAFDGTFAQPVVPMLKYLGSFHYTVNETSKTGDKILRTCTSDYLFSQNSASFGKAQKDCNKVSSTTTLLYAEIKQELENVKKSLEEQDSYGSAFWIGGKYSGKDQSFIWLNGVRFAAWTPWSTGMPSMKGNAARVSAHLEDDFEFHTEVKTTLNRYICETVICT